ncbi:MAG: RimK family alpha-L-glutamate ligase [Thermoanaerobaculaceae bacterium]|nr:RimK family alpha-L-glutamate ligase [Thermoanaerobaculaceae bacterium]
MSTVAVLTARPDLGVYRELEAAGDRLGHRVLTLDALRLVASAARPGVWSEGRALPLGEVRAVLPRVGNWRPDSTLAVLGALQRAGVPSLNDGAAIRTGRDHWLTACALASAGVPHPETVAGSEPEAVAAAAAAVCGFPCVVKLRRSRRGVGVIRCTGAAELEAVLDSFWRLGEEPVVQRFCPPGGVSRRVLVLEDEVLGATEHRAGAGEFRANAARSAEVRAVELDRGLAELGMSAARVVGLGFAGVDLIPDGERWLVGEVNPSPGWRHFAAATGVPVAERLVTALARLGGGE